MRRETGQVKSNEQSSTDASTEAAEHDRATGLGCHRYDRKEAEQAA
jgi:hypothetical protein